MFWSKGPPKLNQTRHDDPLERALEPPRDETPQQRQERLLAQEEAQRISQEIDASLREAKKALERRRKAIKVLILGQAESGKSTLLKNFQLLSSPNHFSREQTAWKTVIQLNLISSVKRILEVLQEEWDAEAPPTPPPSRPGTGATPPSRPTTGSSRPTPITVLTDEHRRIRMRLSPLFSVESTLNRKLLPETCDRVHGRGLCVPAGNGWKSILEGAIAPRRSSQRPASRVVEMGGRPATSDNKNSNDPTMILAACKDDIVSLWEDPVVKGLLEKHNVRLEHEPGFFLDDAERIASPSYTPTDSDILRARLRTLGVDEHRFTLDDSEWYIYDVGGSRSMRANWIPYFDDVDAIIFLVPLAFNQVLEEDPKVNRLEDSINLWREICSSKLLANVTIILLFNKMDILQSTLASGVPVVRYVPSYGDAPNDVEHVTRYFRDKFRSYLKRLSPHHRQFMCHETSAINTRATNAVLVGVREGILGNHLVASHVV